MSERDPRFYRRSAEHAGMMVRYEVEIQRWLVIDERQGDSHPWYGFRCYMCGMKGRPWTVRYGAEADAARHALNCATIQSKHEPGAVLVRVVDESGRAVHMGPPFSADSIAVIDGVALDFPAEVPQ